MQITLDSVPFSARAVQFAMRVALAAAVSAGLYTVGVTLTPYAGPLLLTVPLAGLILAERAPSECGLWLLLTTGVVSLGLGSAAAASFVLLFGVPACAVAVGLRRRWSIERTVLAGMAAWSASVASMALLAYGDLTTLIAAARQQLAHGFDVTVSTYGSFGVPEDTLAAATAEREVLVTGLLEVLPALVVLCGALMVIANVVLLRNWTSRLHDVDLRLWRTPEPLIWALIGTGFGMFLPWRPLGLLARNVFLVLLGGYFCQGLAIVSYFLERLRLPRGVRVAGYLLIAIQHIIAGIVLALGIFDLWGNFRRMNAGSPNMQIPTDSD
jgi:uncharacterized protein YybS (DUF2232 family)